MQTEPHPPVDSLDSGPADLVDVAELADRLRPVMLKLSRHLRREAQKVGVSALDAQLLGIIKKWPGAGVSELADLEQMSRPAMSVHIKRLEAAGWLMREADQPDGDKRRVRLALTPKGAQALNAIRRSRNDWLAARLAMLTSAERDALDVAVEPLARLVEVKA
jgi:DNA-binding MarR family transcriptional regulator